MAEVDRTKGRDLQLRDSCFFCFLIGAGGWSAIPFLAFAVGVYLVIFWCARRQTGCCLSVRLLCRYLHLLLLGRDFCGAVLLWRGWSCGMGDDFNEVVIYMFRVCMLLCCGGGVVIGEDDPCEVSCLRMDQLIGDFTSWRS